MTIGYLWREHAASDGVTELRLHGVGGTTPEAMLFDDRPVQVAGDALAGFYRTADCDGRHVEAYSWGGLTSRSGTRAFWLLLLPFTLANVAGWAQVHPRGTGAEEGDPRRTIQGRLVQVLGLLLTVQVVVGVAVLAMDLVAYQCGGQPECRAGRWWMSPFQQPWLADSPGRRMAAGAALPVALLALFLYLGRRSAGRYEGKHPPIDDTATGPRLLRPSTWDKQGEIGRVRWAHVAAGVAAVASLLALASATLADDRNRNPALAQVVAVAAFAVLLTAAASVVARGVGSGVVLALALAALAAAVVAAFRLPAYRFTGPTDPVRGIARASEVLFAVQFALLVVTALAAAGRRVRAAVRNEAWPVIAFRWGLPVVLSGLAVLITGAFFGGSMLRVADTLGTPADTSTPAAASALLRVPPAYDWVSVLFLGTLVAVVLFVALPMWVWMRPLREEIDDIEQDEGYGTQARDCTTAIARARRFTAAIRLFDFPITLVVAAVFLTTFVAALFRFEDGAVQAFGPFPEWASPFRNAASWVTTFLPLGAVGLVANGYRSPERRRTIGIVWDLGTFWPRWFHPLAPPCYAERAIPDLQCRILQLTDEDGRVLLSAHSQGTIWATVALNSLPADRLARVAYLTYGSPMAYLYPAMFPDHFPAATRGLRDKLFPPAARTANGVQPRRWRNLWRRTDPIGGRVSDEDGPLDDQEPLPDPAGSLTTCGACRPIAGHSHYLQDRALVEYTEAVAGALEADIERQRASRQQTAN